MAKVLSGSIDVTKIDKSKIQKKNKNGEPFKNGAQYLNVSVVINDDEDGFGNIASITIGQTEEERKSKSPRVYLGNLKLVWESDSIPQTPAAKPSKKGDESPDLPF